MRLTKKISYLPGVLNHNKIITKISVQKCMTKYSSGLMARWCQVSLVGVGSGLGGNSHFLSCCTSVNKTNKVSFLMSP